MKILPVPMLAAGLALLPSFAQAEFFADGKAGLELRNFYFNRDYRQPGASQSYSEEWAQGFLLRYESGLHRGALRPGRRCAGPAGRQAGLLARAIR